jgi:pilus assembly protein CpaB
VLRKPGEPNNPVVETVSMNDLRYNIYGGARYPAPAVVGSFGTGLVNGMTTGMNGASARIASATNSTPTLRPAAARKGATHAQDKIQVFRGTKSDDVEVGGR